MTATFSEAMTPLTITTPGTFTLKQGVTPISGVVTYSGVTAVFTSDSSLAYSTVYTATITTVAEDLAGNALTVNKVWSFTIGAAPSTTTPPTGLSSWTPMLVILGVGVIAVAAIYLFVKKLTI